MESKTSRLLCPNQQAQQIAPLNQNNGSHLKKKAPFVRMLASMKQFTKGNPHWMQQVFQPQGHIKQNPMGGLETNSSSTTQQFSVHGLKKVHNSDIGEAVKMLELEQIKSQNRLRLFNQVTLRTLNASKATPTHRSLKSFQKHQPFKSCVDVLLNNGINKTDQVNGNQNFRSTSVVSAKTDANLLSENKFKRIHTARTDAKSSMIQRKESLSIIGESRRVEKLVNEMIIAKENEKERRKKLKSAQIVKRNKQDTKISKECFFQNRIEAIKKQNRIKLENQQREYLKKVKKVENLKKAELKALQEWKKLRVSQDSQS